MSTSNVDLSSLLQAALGSTSGGINVSAAVSAAVNAAAAPEVTWQNQQVTLQTQTSAINQLGSEASALSDALNALNDPGGAMAAVTANSSDSSVVTASALPATAIGSHTVIVKSLATTASWYSGTEPSSSTALTAGSFDLTAGGTTTTIALGSGVNTLDDLANSINSQELGVTASVVNDASGARLAIVSQTSGETGDISITNASGMNFTQASAGANASLTVDGIPISSASNTVTGVVNGLTLDLQSAAPGTQVNIGLTPDATQINNALTSFVNAYNTLIKDVNSQFAFNSTTNTAGTLAGDSAVRTLQGELLDATNYSSGSGAGISSLAALGISTNQDGTLTLNTATLNNAVANNFSAVQGFFQGAASNGFATNLNSVLNTFTDPSQGAFTLELNSISAENSDLQNQINTFNVYLTTLQTRLQAEYSQADIELEQLPQQIKQVQAELNMDQSNSN